MRLIAARVLHDGATCTQNGVREQNTVAQKRRIYQCDGRDDGGHRVIRCRMLVVRMPVRECDSFIDPGLFRFSLLLRKRQIEFRTARKDNDITSIVSKVREAVRSDIPE